MTDVSFSAGYLLVSKPLRSGLLTGRIDLFAVDDESLRDLENNRERGAAATGALARPLAGATELVTEVQAVWSDRPARARIGLRADQVDVQTRIALRARF